MKSLFLMKKPENKFQKKESESYRIVIKEKADKQLSKLSKKFAVKIDELIQLLAHNPRPIGCKNYNAMIAFAVFDTLIIVLFTL